MTNFQAMLFSKSLQAKLMNIAMSKTFNVPDAEDLVQTTYLKAMERQDQFSGDKIDPWIVTILKNTFIDSTRKKKPDLPGDDLPELAEEGGQQGALLERDRDICLEKLDASEREVIAMKQTMTYEDIAEVLEIKAGSLRVKLLRAKEKFMICMGISND
jgi:RNA polymerase sigma-70 factor (ECF subfamily)